MLRFGLTAEIVLISYIIDETNKRIIDAEEKIFRIGFSYLNFQNEFRFGREVTLKNGSLPWQLPFFYVSRSFTPLLTKNIFNSFLSLPIASSSALFARVSDR